MATESTEFGTGKTLIVLTVVIGCFAVLWPKIFYPAFQDASPSSKKHEGKPVCLPCAIKFEEEKKLQFHYELCNLIVKNDKEYRHKPRPASLMFRLCRETVLQACHLELDDTVVKNLQKSIEENVTTSGTANLTTCLLAEFRIDGHHIVLALHKKNASAAKQIHQERPPHLRPEMMHPALREKGQNIPPRMRTIERDARPGPMPGMRPTIGGPGHVVQSNKQASTMSIVMPIYTLVIVLFFIYTITKVLFKKNQDNTPKVMDFHMDPEQRKFVFSEEYSDADPLSMKSYLKKQERDQKRQEVEKENSKIVIDAIEGIVKEIDEYKAQKAEEDKKESPALSSRLVEHVEGETAEETVALSRDQTQQVETSTHVDEVQEAVGSEGVIATQELKKEETVCEEVTMEEPVCQDISIEKPICDVPVEEVLCEDSTAEEVVCEEAPVEMACEGIPVEEVVCEDTPVEMVCEDIPVENVVCEDTSEEKPVFDEMSSKEPVCDEAEEVKVPVVDGAVRKETFVENQVCEETVKTQSVCEECPAEESVCQEADDGREDSSTEPSGVDKLTRIESITETIKETSESITETVQDTENIKEDSEVTHSIQVPGKSDVDGIKMSVPNETKPKESSQARVDVGKDVQTETEHIPEERVDETTPTPGGGEYEEVEVVVRPQIRELEMIDDGSILSYILDGSVGSDMQLLVSEAQCEALSLEECHLNDPTSDYADISDPVVISGKMTISFIEGTTLSSLSELPDLSLDASQSRGLAVTALDEDSSMYAELPLDEPTTKESTPEEAVLADIARQIEELENAMKEVQEAAGVLKEEVEAKDSEVETKSATEDEEEDVSEYKSVRVEEVSTAEDYISTAHQASRLLKDGTDQSRAPPNLTQSLQKTDHADLHQEHQHEVQKEEEEHHQEVPVPKESTPEKEEKITIEKEPVITGKYDAVDPLPSDLSDVHPGIPEVNKKQGEEFMELVNQQQQEFHREIDDVSETDSNNPVLSVLQVDQELFYETAEDRKTHSEQPVLPVDQEKKVVHVEPIEEEEFVLYPDTLSEEAREYVLQLSAITVKEAVHEAQSIVDQTHTETPEDEKLSQTDSEHPVLSVQCVDQEILDQLPEEDKLSQTDSEHPVLSVQYVDQEILDQIPEEDKLSQTDSEHPVLSLQYVDQEILDQIPEEDKLGQNDSEHPVLSVQYVDQEILDQIPEEDKLSHTDSEHPVLSLQYVDQELFDQIPEEDKLSQTDSEHPVLSVQYVDRELLDQLPEEDMLSQTDSENPVLSVQYVNRELLDQLPEEDKLSQTDSENPVLSMQYVDRELLDQLSEEDKLSQTDSENPVLSVQYVDPRLLNQVAEEDKLSQTDSENPVLSVQYVDREMLDQLPGEDKTDNELPVLPVQYVDEVSSSKERSNLNQEETIIIMKSDPEDEETEFVLYPNTLSEDAKEYVEDIAALTVKSAIAEAQRLVATLATEEQEVKEALAEAMREERSPSPTDMVEFYCRSRSGTPVDAAAVIVHDAAPQSAVVLPQQVTDLKHKAFDNQTEQPEEKSTSPSEQSSFEMVGNNGGSTSSFENISRNGEEEDEVKTEL